MNSEYLILTAISYVFLLFIRSVAKLRKSSQVENTRCLRHSDSLSPFLKLGLPPFSSTISA